MQTSRWLLICSAWIWIPWAAHARPGVEPQAAAPPVARHEPAVPASPPDALRPPEPAEPREPAPAQPGKSSEQPAAPGSIERPPAQSGAGDAPESKRAASPEPPRGAEAGSRATQPVTPGATPASGHDVRATPREGYPNFRPDQRETPHQPTPESGTARGIRLTPHLEIRQRYETGSHPEFGEGKATRGGYLLQRYMPSLTLDVDDWLTSTVQFKSARVGYREGGARPIDRDEFDLHQAFAEWNRPDGADGRFRLKVGRQELVFGAARLVGNREGPNVRQSFDAVRASHEMPGRRIDVFYSRPVSSDPGVFDDHPEDGNRLFGVYSVFDADFLPGTGHMDAYYLGSSRQALKLEQGTANDQRHSFGVRLWGSDGRWDYNDEFIYQTGSFGSDAVQAWTAATVTGYTFANWPTEPRLGLSVNAASGDSHAGDHTVGTFNALYPRGSYFGEIALIGPANLIDVHPSLDFKLTRGLTLTLDADFFWRQQTGDGVYGPGLNLIRGASGSGEREVGWQWSPSLQWAANPNTTLFASYSRFHPGRFLQATGAAQPVDLFTTWINFKI